MTKIEQLKSGLKADIAMLLIISAIAGLSSYFLTMAWIEQELIQFIASDDVESSIEQSLTKQGWQDLICPCCIGNDSNIVKIYNDSQDTHED